MTKRAQQAQKTRAVVLATSQVLFAEQGYDATSLQQIAERMGVAKANVYYYFRTKEALLEALLSPMIADIAEILDEAQTISNRDERVAFVVSGYVRQVVSAYRAFGSLNLGDPALRRELQIARDLEAMGRRGLHILFGPQPTPAEEAAYWITQDLAPVLRRLGHLRDPELADVLISLTLRAMPTT